MVGEVGFEPTLLKGTGPYTETLQFRTSARPFLTPVRLPFRHSPKKTRREIKILFSIKNIKYSCCYRLLVITQYFSRLPEKAIYVAR